MAYLLSFSTPISLSIKPVPPYLWVMPNTTSFVFHMYFNVILVSGLIYLNKSNPKVSLHHTLQFSLLLFIGEHFMFFSFFLNYCAIDHLIFVYSDLLYC